MSPTTRTAVATGAGRQLSRPQRIRAEVGATEPSPPQGSPTQRLSRAPLPTVLLHWLLAMALAVSLATGLRIAADAPDALVSAALAPVLPQGAALLWHLISGALVLAAMLAYTLYQVRSGLGRRLLQLPRVGAAGARAARLRRLDLVLYWLAFGLLLLAAGTGVLQYLGAAPPGARRLLEALHRMAAWGLLGYAAAHVGLQLAGGGARRLLAILLPRPAHLRIGAWAAALSLGLILAAVAADRVLVRDLTLPRAVEVPVLDGRVDDRAWAQAPALRIALANGANLPGGESILTLRGVHDAERVYLLCEWTDPTRSTAHVPLLKTAQGWRILQTAYRSADENRWYEDKLALMLAPPGRPLAALTSVHLGAQPLRGEPGAPGGRGLHYTTDGGILDVWHWKSVRNGAEHQADDNFFGPPLPAPAQTPRTRDPDSGAWLPRYTGGYRKDPPGTFSGYEMNWEFFSEGRTQPLRLPKDPRDLALPEAAGGAPPAPPATAPEPAWIEFNDTRPYADGPDTLPVGTLLPSVLPTGRLTGDRGDIAARGHWADGRWSLELSRRLDTGSSRDVAITDGTLLWVAVFDHTQTRHAYHLRPVRLRLR
jgi:hypothetical protein